ncbi:MAG: family 16 glycoside hydrolase [Aggregatilineales bacterium]
MLDRTLPRPAHFRPWRALMLTLISALAFLSALNLVLLALINADQPIKAPSGTLLYVSTFDDDPDTDADDSFNAQWAQYAGQDSAMIADGILYLSIGSPGGVFSDLDYPFADVDVEVLAGWQDGEPDVIEAAEISLMFRYQDVDNFYAFKLRGDGAYRAERRQSGTLDVLSEWQIAPQALSGPGAFNRLRVVAQGDQLRFFLNDQPVLLCPKGADRRSTWNGLRSAQCLSNNRQTADVLIDSALKTGKIALGAVAGQGATGFRVAFDNVIVLAP